MHLLRPSDPEWPSALRRLARPPAELVVDGSLAGLARAVGIVGTRRATPSALDFAHRLARELADLGVVVVSGGAEGIDRAAHEGAMEARSGCTVAVLPTALSTPYPRRHAALFARIATRGARITEHARATRPHKAHFLERNRIIAALSCAVVVVQAPFKSGALRTASDARTLGVPVLATPWSPDEPMAEGGLALLSDGARLCRSASDVLVAMGERPARARRAERPGPRDDDAGRLLALLDERALDRDTLVTRSGLPAARAQALLVELLLEGAIHEDAHGIRRR